MNYDPTLEKLKTHIKNQIKIIRGDIEKTKRNITGEFIQNRVNAIQLNRVENPGRFFAKAQPDSVFRSQQVWTVEYEKEEMENNKKKKRMTTSSIPETVQREVKNAWEKIFSTKKAKTKDVNPAFISKKFLKRREKILNKDECLIKKVTENEMKETITNLSNGTACGPDNIPSICMIHCFHNKVVLWFQFYHPLLF